MNYFPDYEKFLTRLTLTQQNVKIKRVGMDRKYNYNKYVLYRKSQLKAIVIYFDIGLNFLVHEKHYNSAF